MDRLAVLRAIDKYDRLGLRAVYDLLTVGRKDSSGDFMSGCGLTAKQAVFILSGMVKYEHEQRVLDTAWRRLCALEKLGFVIAGVDIKNTPDELVAFDKAWNRACQDDKITPY